MLVASRNYYYNYIPYFGLSHPFAPLSSGFLTSVLRISSFVPLAHAAFPGLADLRSGLQAVRVLAPGYGLSYQQLAHV